MTLTLVRLYWVWADAAYRMKAQGLGREVLRGDITADEATERLVSMRRGQVHRLRSAGETTV